MPISGGSALEFETKTERKHYFREVRNICVEGRVEKTRWSHIPITFSEEDVRLQGFPHNDALVIEANIASWTLGKLLVDNGSSADIIFADAFDKMGLNRDLLQPPDTPLYGFGGRVIHALGKLFSRYPSAQFKTPELNIYPSMLWRCIIPTMAFWAEVSSTSSRQSFTKHIYASKSRQHWGSSQSGAIKMTVAT
jgi:hypothetical protein